MGELLKALQLSAERRGAGGNRARQMGQGISRGVANSAARAQAGSEEGGFERQEPGFRLDTSMSKGAGSGPRAQRCLALNV